MLPADVLQFDVEPIQVDRCFFFEHSFRRYDPKFLPIVDRSCTRLVTGCEQWVAPDLFFQILDPRRFLGLLHQDGSANCVSCYWNTEFTRPIDMIPVVVGIDDTRYRWELTSRKLGLDEASQRRAVTGIHQHALMPGGDHANGALHGFWFRVMRKVPGMLAELR